MATSEQIIGIDKVVAALGGWSTQAKTAIEQAFKGGVDQGVGVAVQLSPVRTGYMQSRNARKDVGWSGKTFEVDMINDADYALFVNSGTVHQAAQPFFSQGVEAASQAIKSNLNALK